MSITKALKMLDPIKVVAAIEKELDKVETQYESLVPISKSLLQEKSLWLRSQMFVKEKLLGDVSARLAIDGSKQPSDSYNSTYSGTSSTELLLLLLSTCVADAASRGCSPTLTLSGFDIKGAFLHCDLTPADTNGYQFVTNLPKDIPGPKAGQLRAIVKGQYGIKQSNNIFNSHLGGTLEQNGYHSEPLTPYIYTKRCPTNASNFLAVNTHVDDGAVFSTSSLLLAELKAVLTARFGELTWHDNLSHFCGIDFFRHPDHSVQLSMHTHLLKYLHDTGMDDIPGALTPTLSDFFDLPCDPTPYDSTSYQSTQGNLLFYCPIRSDIKMSVHHLSRSNHHPTISDRHKQIQILRYLKAHPYDGPRFSSDPLSYPNGVQLTVDADSSHASLPNCQDQSGIIYRIGRDNAPFSTHASAVPGISLSPQSSEYATMSTAAKNSMFYRQALEGLGFPQLFPTPIYEDNLPAINLVVAPDVTKNSRHLLIEHHYIRWLYSQGFVIPIHQGTNDMLADFFTKVLPPRKFHYFKDKIFNSVLFSYFKNNIFKL